MSGCEVTQSASNRPHLNLGRTPSQPLDSQPAELSLPCLSATGPHTHPPPELAVQTRLDIIRRSGLREWKASNDPHPLSPTASVY